MRIGIRLLAFVSMINLTACNTKPGKNISKASVNSSMVDNQDSLNFNQEELSSSYDVFFAPCNVNKSARVKFATLFKQEIVDSILIVSMNKINCCKIDFLFSGLSHNTDYNVNHWSFNYEQLILFKDDKRTCPKVVTSIDKTNSDFKVMSCEGKTQESNLSTEALRFLNSKIQGSYPCEIKYTYQEIDSMHSKHPEIWIRG